MALKLNKHTPQVTNHPTQTTSKPTSEATQGQSVVKSSPPSGMAFIKKGAEAKQAMAAEDQKAEQRKQAAGKERYYRFYLPEDKSTSVTFLDGDLTDNILDVPFLYEHNVFMNGHWKNWFICTNDSEPCPICEGGTSKPYYAGFLTVIDHSTWVDKNNVTHKNEVKIFVAKRETLKILLALSAKRGGLRGCKFDVTRTGAMSPNVGNMFDFTEKYSDQQLHEMYGDKASPIDFNTVLSESYLDAAALRNHGFGALNSPVGSEKGVSDQDYSNHL